MRAITAVARAATFACGGALAIASAAGASETPEYGWRLVGAGLDGHSVVIAAAARPAGYCFTDDANAQATVTASGPNEFDVRLRAAAPSDAPCNVPGSSEAIITTFAVDLGAGPLQGPRLTGPRRADRFSSGEWRQATSYLGVHSRAGCRTMPRLAGLLIVDAKSVVRQAFDKAPTIQVKGDRTGYVTATRPKAGALVCPDTRSVVLRGVAVG